MAVKIGDVTIRIGASTNELEKDLRKAERALQATAQKFTAIGQNLTLGVTAPVLAAGAAAFKMASDYEESLNKVRVAFGSSSSSVEEFSKTAIDSIGLAEQSALDMAALFGDMATSMGLTRPAAAEMSTSLVQLAGDLSSFKNINIEEVTTALAGVFTGETESLKRLGIVMTEANVQAYALEKGIKKKLNTMSQAEKVALRYEYVLNATKNAQGDFARTSDGAANQLRALQQSVKQLGQQFGSVLLPIITPLISALRQAVSSFANLSDEAKKTITTVAGVAAAVGPLLIAYGKLTNLYGIIATGTARIIALWISQAAAAATASGGVATLTASTVTFTTTVRAALAFIAPYAAAVAAVGAAVYLLYKNYQNRNKELEQANTLDKIAAKNVESERQKTIGLIGVIKSEVATKEQKKKAVEALQQISPKYFGDLDSEKININDLNKSYDAYLKNLLSISKAKAAREEVDKLSGALLSLEKANFERIQQSAINADKLQQNEVGYTPDQLQKAEKSYKNLDDVNQKYYEKQKQSLQNQIDFFAKFAAEEVKINDSRGTGQNEGRSFINIKTLETTKKGISDLIPLFKDLSKEATKLTLKELGQNAKISQVQLNKTAQFLKDVNSEIEAIQVRSDRGFITNQQADLEKLEVFKKALQDALQQGLGTGVVDQISQQITDLGVTAKPQFDDIFDYLGDKIASIPSISKKLGEDLEELSKKISEQAKGWVNAFGQLLSVVSGFYDLQGQNLDANAEKQKKAIENSLMSEEAKAEAIAKLEESTEKKRRAIARKQAAAEKAQAIFSATLNGANAVLKAFVQGGPILAAITGALVAAQIATIAAQPLPSLNVGTDLVKKDGLAMIHKGEAIVPANVVKGGFTGGGNQLTGRLSGIDILISARNSERYLNRIG